MFFIRAFLQKFKNTWIKRVIDHSCFPADNKELRLKMDFILEENERLKAIIQSIESQQQQQQQQWANKNSSREEISLFLYVTKGGATTEVKIIIQPVAVPWAQDIALYFFVDASQSDQVITSSIYLSQCEYLKTPSNTTNSIKPSSYYDDEIWIMKS